MHWHEAAAAEARGAAYMPHVTQASETLGLSPVALLITNISASISLHRPCCGFRGFHYRQTAAHFQSGAIDKAGQERLCNNFYSSEIGCLCVSSLVTRGSALPDAYQLRPDIALTEIEQLNNLIQLSRGSSAASV